MSKQIKPYKEWNKYYSYDEDMNLRLRYTKSSDDKDALVINNYWCDEYRENNKSNVAWYEYHTSRAGLL